MKRITQITLAAATFLVALALATPAEARGRRDHPRHRVEHRHQRQHTQHRQFDRHGHRADRHDRSFRHDRFGIPHRIRDDRRRVYRPYYERNVYFAPHHNRQDHGRLDYHGRRFSISLGF